MPFNLQHELLDDFNLPMANDQPPWRLHSIREGGSGNHDSGRAQNKYEPKKNQIPVSSFSLGKKDIAPPINSSHKESDSSKKNKAESTAQARAPVKSSMQDPKKGFNRPLIAQSISSPDLAQLGQTPASKDKKKIPNGHNSCGCPTSPEDQERNIHAYAFARSLKDERGRVGYTANTFDCQSNCSGLIFA